ncbi:MAG: VanZ family protein [Bacteroidales bacterium]|nr:VanZ family protein [Candidatus Cryptobacteroides caccocaballi]
MKLNKTFWRLLLVVYLITVCYLCFWNFQPSTSVPWSIWGIPTDKIVHFLMFLPAAPLFYLSLPEKWLPSVWAKILWLVATALAGAGVAAFTELGQAFTSYRTSDITDFWFDCYSIGGATVITMLCVIFYEIHIRSKK